jgi:hypothetical protein
MRQTSRFDVVNVLHNEFYRVDRRFTRNEHNCGKLRPRIETFLQKIERSPQGVLVWQFADWSLAGPKRSRCRWLTEALLLPGPLHRGHFIGDLGLDTQALVWFGI